MANTIYNSLVAIFTILLLVPYFIIGLVLTIILFLGIICLMIIFLPVLLIETFIKWLSGK